MPKFKIKDLMVDISSARLDKLTDQICLAPTRHCPVLSINCGKTFDGCGLVHSICWGASNFGPTYPCGPTNHCGPTVCVGKTACLGTDCLGGTDGGCGVNYSTCIQGTGGLLLDVEKLLVNPADVKKVQKQLGDLFKAVEERGVEIARDMQPDADTAAVLEVELKAALEQVQAIKKKG